MSDFKKIGILGGGSWATALTKIIMHNVSEVNWYMRSSQSIEYLNKFGRNKNYISSINLNTEQIHLSDDINQVIEQSDILVFAIPSAFLSAALEKVNVPLSKKYIISAI